MTGSDSKKLSRTVPACPDGRRPRILRQYIGPSLIVILISVAAYLCFKLILACLVILVNLLEYAIENANRSTHTVVIQRFDDELHVETQIDPKLQISQVSLASQQQHACIPRETVKDFEKGTEVFSQGDNCFVRFYNRSTESYEQQMLLFQMLKGLPLQQTAEPAVFQAVQHLQFTDRVYSLLGRRVAARCHLRRLFWILPAPPLLGRRLTACRCFDTLHARLSVCLQAESPPPGETPWSWDFPEETEQVQTKRPEIEMPVKPRRGVDGIVKKPRRGVDGVVKKPRRGMDSIVKKPDMMHDDQIE